MTTSSTSGSYRRPELLSGDGFAGKHLLHHRRHTHRRSFFRGGALGHIYASQLRYPLTTSDTITVESGNHDPGNTWAKAMSVEEFDLGTGKRSCLPSTAGAVARTAAADPPSIGRTVDGPVKEVLYLHALAAEGPNTDAYTWDSNYTQIAGDGTTGGADDFDMHIRGGYRIVSASATRWT